VVEPAHERRWRGLDAGAGPREEVEWSYRIPKQIGVEWVEWSGVGGVEWLFWEWSAPKHALTLVP